MAKSPPDDVPARNYHGVSTYTTRSEFEYDDAPGLPSYSDSVAADRTRIGHETPPPADEYEIIAPPKTASEGWQSRKSRKENGSAQTKTGRETTLRMDKRLVHPAQLFDYVNDYLRLIKPQPQVRVQGWHWETRRRDNKNQQERVQDFDIVLDMSRYLKARHQFSNSHDAAEDIWWVPYTVDNGSKAHRGSWRKTRARGYTQDVEIGTDRKPELLDWCEDFCSNSSPLKIFRVSRQVTGLDTELIRVKLIEQIRQTHYRGHVDVSFPIADKNVDIYSPHWINRARITWIRWIFYLSFLWIFTWPVLFFMTKRWSVYNVDWRFSYDAGDSNGRTRKVYASISEQEWIHKHASLIKSLALDRFNGDATDFPTDVAQRRTSGPPMGNRNEDPAASFVHSNIGAWEVLGGRGGDGWGVDS